MDSPVDNVPIGNDRGRYPRRTRDMERPRLPMIGCRGRYRGAAQMPLGGGPGEWRSGYTTRAPTRVPRAALAVRERLPVNAPYRRAVVPGLWPRLLDTV